MTPSHLPRLAAVALCLALSVTGCSTAPSEGAVKAANTAPAAARAALAPSGTLRIAVYPGSPTSLVQQAPPEAMRGVAVDLGRSLAMRLGVPSQVVVYPRVAEVVAALQRGDADFTITNASADRARLVDFAPPLLDLELGVLVPAGSRVDTVGHLDQPGITVGVSQGGSSERVLGGRLSQAKIRSFASLDAVRAALVARDIDAFATNKGILFEVGERVPGSRVLEGRWGAEALAPAVPKGREAGLPFLATFAADVRSNGELDRATQRAGLRGAAPVQP